MVIPKWNLVKYVSIFVTSEIQSETETKKKRETGNIRFFWMFTAPGSTSMQKQAHNISRNVR